MIEAFCRTVDAVNERIGRVACWLLVPLVLIMLYEVVLRDFFLRPTIWAWDINFHVGALLILLGGGYNLLHRQHIMVDAIYERFSPRARAIIDLATSPVFLISFGVFLWLAIKQAKLSFRGDEIYFSLFAPHLWPLRTIVIVGVLLLLIQGVVKFIRDLGLATRSGGEGMS